MFMTQQYCNSVNASLYFEVMTDETQKLDFYRTDEEGGVQDDSQMAQTFELMSKRSQVGVPRTKEFKRQQVIDAFQDSFELIGGIPRLAAWAHFHPTEFYKLYSKLLPSQAIHDFGQGDGKLHIVHSIAPGALDTAPEGLVDKDRIIEHQPQENEDDK